MAHAARAAADLAALSLQPVRRHLLQLLAHQPDSASGLARRLGLPRQKVNYHLRALERAGLVELFDQRQRRGLVERRLKPRAELQDQFSSAYQVAAATTLIREVSDQRERAADTQQRLATLTLETEIAFASPADFTHFSEDLQQAVQALVERYHRPTHPGARTHKLLVAAHPRPLEDSPQ